MCSSVSAKLEMNQIPTEMLAQTTIQQYFATILI